MDEHCRTYIFVTSGNLCEQIRHDSRDWPTLEKIRQEPLRTNASRAHKSQCIIDRFSSPSNVAPVPVTDSENARVTPSIHLG